MLPLLPIRDLDRFCRIVWTLGILVVALRFILMIWVLIYTSSFGIAFMPILLGKGQIPWSTLLVGLGSALQPALQLLVEIGALRLLIFLVQRGARDDA